MRIVPSARTAWRAFEARSGVTPPFVDEVLTKEIGRLASEPEPYRFTGLYLAGLIRKRVEPILRANALVHELLRSLFEVRRAYRRALRHREL